MRSQKVEVLRALRCADPKRVGEISVRARYASAADGGSALGYIAEEGVDPASNTETFVAVRAEIDNRKVNGRWLITPGLDAEMELSGSTIPRFGNANREVSR